MYSTIVVSSGGFLSFYLILQFVDEKNRRGEGGGKCRGGGLLQINDICGENFHTILLTKIPLKGSVRFSSLHHTTNAD